MKKRCIVLTGAGISRASGIETFRDQHGLWEKHKIEDVATPEAFSLNPGYVHRFYNERRRQVCEASPNAAHLALAQWEKEQAEDWEVFIITQNVDDLHERAGSKNILHLHGELKKVRSTQNPNLILDWDQEVKPSDRGPDGAPLRPHIVWFGESVPAIEEAEALCATAHAWFIIGTSMAVYPAAGLIHHMPNHAPGWFIDPAPPMRPSKQMTVIEAEATLGVPKALEQLMLHFHGA